jgi:hypothetical protein
MCACRLAWLSYISASTLNRFIFKFINISSMGGNVSKDKSRSEVLNEFVTEVVTNVTNTKKTTISTTQKIKVECSQEVYDKVVAACKEARCR